LREIISGRDWFSANNGRY